jgi:phospholipid-transporting ATPase
VNLVIKSDDARKYLKFLNQKELIDSYFLLLASAHECLIQIDEKTSEISYQGPSPDEITLVDAAMRMGFQYRGGSASQQEFLI